MGSPFPGMDPYIEAHHLWEDFHSKWSAHFRRPLPAVPIPLAARDPDIPLNIQPLVDAIYDRSRYERDIDCHRPLHPPLDPEDAAWLEQRLRQGHSRGGRR